jgi:transposase InsO family protein
MEERMRFVLAYASGSYQMAELTRQYGISRQCGYKWWHRYQQEGLEGVKEQSRAPDKYPQQISAAVVKELLAERGIYGYGGKKIIARLVQNQPDKLWPSAATADRYFKKHGFTVARSHRRRRRVSSPPILQSDAPNDLWTADFKGEFRLGNRQYCYPLTVTDSFSRYLLQCHGMPSTGSEGVQKRFDWLFREYGLPVGILTDNGVPFRHAAALARLSRLSVWWIKWGIIPLRIQPGHPEQNPRHERMHRELKKDTTRPPAANMRAQQASFNEFCRRYNEERPHEGLQMKRPVQLYQSSPRRYGGPEPAVDYPGHFEVRRVASNGFMKWRNQSVFLTKVLGGEYIGLEAVADCVWSIYFGAHFLGRLDETTLRIHE